MSLSKSLHHVAKLLFLSWFAASNLYANEIRLTGTQPTVLHTNTASSKQITLQRITLSTKGKQRISTQIKPHHKHAALHKAAVLTSLPAAVQLGMDKVPVLDQGIYGTCVTFAITAALDAAYGKGDYISQVCNLQLGTYLHEQDESYPSGWIGSDNYIVLGQIEKYGVIDKRYQQTIGCKGIKQYPTYIFQEPIPYPAAYHLAHSHKILQQLSWQSLLNIEDAFTEKHNPDALLNAVKTALANGHRLTASYLLDDYHNYYGGAFGTYKEAYDSWIITPAITAYFLDPNRQSVAGHAIIITGYDDNAIIHGPDNSEHVGVLTLRNSWSERAGDHGNYYMSYDYFKTLVDSVQEIIP